MTDKPKRKRSEIVKPTYSKRALIWLILFYSLLLMSDTQNLVPAFITNSLAIIALGFTSFSLKILRRLKPNTPTALAIIFTGISSVIVAWLLFTKSAITGWLVFMGSSPSPIENVALLLLAIIPFMCLWLTLELHFLIIHFLNAFPSYEVEKQKNIAMKGVETEPEIPLELLAESESVKQQMK
jgi:hypothetical protein